MRNFLMVSIAALSLAGALSAAADGAIRLKDGTSQAAFNIQAETVSGILWEVKKDRPGTKVRLWDADAVLYTGQKLDEYNGLARKLAAGRGDRLIADAQAMLNEEKKPGGWSDFQWNAIKLSCKYYLAMGRYLQGEYATAITGLEEYIKEAENADNLVTAGVVPRISFKSAVSGKSVTNGGGLNRYYLDALETLGLAYLQNDDAANATKKAFKPLQELTEKLSTNSGDEEYFDWGLRALRASAGHAESVKDYKGAKAAYEDLSRIAVKKNAGRESRASYEAQLKVGFMMILSGEAGSAQSRFTEAVTNWEKTHKADGGRPWQPRNNWISPDLAYLTAGSYVGQGMVMAHSAKNIGGWSKALQNFSTSLAIFNADDEIRSMALLGAANAASKLAELNKDNLVDVKGPSGKMVKKLVAAQGYAKLAEKYLSELTTLLPKTKAAEDEGLPAIRKIIDDYKGD